MDEIVQNKLNQMKELAKKGTLKPYHDKNDAPPPKDGLSMGIRNAKEAAEFLMQLEAVSAYASKKRAI